MLANLKRIAVTPGMVLFLAAAVAAQTNSGTSGSQNSGQSGTTGASGTESSSQSGTTGASGSQSSGQSGTSGASATDSSSQSGTTGASGSQSSGQSGTTGASGSQSSTRSGSTAGTDSGNGGQNASHHDASSSSRNRTEGNSQLTPSDLQFVNDAAHGGLMEVQLAQVAQKQASNEKVKALAQKIEQDHTNANSELKKLADMKGVSLPATMDPKHQGMVDKMSKLNGAAFDKQYARMMVSDHKKDIGEFQRASRDAVDTDVRNFASKTVPVLQQHLEMAQQAQQTAKK